MGSRQTSEEKSKSAMQNEKGPRLGVKRRADSASTR